MSLKLNAATDVIGIDIGKFITSIAGFASTVGWPISPWLDSELGWRAACHIWALIHVALARSISVFRAPLLPKVG
jgi:hypothetical protein